jgi:asparagine synthase (glutamine-hydrolysing)
MCGITGIFSAAGIPAGYYRAHSLLSHRGPDDEGFVAGPGSDGGVVQLAGEKTRGRWKGLPTIAGAGDDFHWVLGHHRLSIIDLSENGHQPMGDATGRYWVVLNGEIYNYHELREELRRGGVHFRSQTDTEVALQAFIRWGEGCFSQFNGMWAMALYDSETRQLVLSRDRFGVKPLYYHLGEDGFLFASEVRFFRSLLKLNVDQRIAAEYVASCHLDHRPETLYREIRQLLPAHYAIYDCRGQELTLRRYWSLAHVQREDDGDYSAAVDRFNELFTSAVDLRMRSDVPVGCLLSGGLDSTSIVCNLGHRGRFGEGGFHFFSAVFREEAFSEKRYIDETQNVCPGLIPHFVTPDPGRLRDDLAGLMAVQEFPFRSLAVYSQNLLYRNVRETSPVVVLLNGQGGDELFGGYTGHYYSLILSALLHGRPGEALREGGWFVRNREGSAAALFLNLLKQAIIHLLNTGLHLPRPGANPLFTKGYRLKAPIFFHDDPFENELRANLCFSALPEYLRYEDRNSMAFALEARLPFLDYRLVEWAFSLPNDFKIHDGVNKRVVRDAVRPYATASVVSRQDKMGFVSPQELWQRTVLSGLMTEVIRDARDMPFLDRKKLLRGFEGYLAGRDGDWAFWWRVFCYLYWLDEAYGK